MLKLSQDLVYDNLRQFFFTLMSPARNVRRYDHFFRLQQKLTYHNGWWHGTNSVFAHLLKSNVTIIAIGNKYSSRVYTSLALSGLFENFPYETEKLSKTLNRTDSLKNASGNDSLNANESYSE